MKPPRHQSTPNSKRANNITSKRSSATGQKPKRSRTSNNFETMHLNEAVENESHSLSQNTSTTYYDNLNNSIFSNLNHISNSNNESLHSVDENSISTVNNTIEESLNTNDQHESNPVMVNDLSFTLHNNNTEPARTNHPAISNIATNSPIELIETSMDRNLPTTDNSFSQIIELNQNTLNFHIRCKTIYKSSIRHFGTNSKVFDAIVCDSTGEIKVTGFNEEVDRLYNSIIVNQTLIIQNGDVQIANDRYRTPYSIYEIRLLSTSLIHQYSYPGFNPMMKITKQEIRNISQTLHGSPVDLEAIVIMDKGVTTTTSQNNGEPIRKRSLKIKDETGIILINIWNNKIDQLPELIMNKRIRIRNGKTNHYNGNKSHCDL